MLSESDKDLIVQYYSDGLTMESIGVFKLLKPLIQENQNEKGY